MRASSTGHCSQASVRAEEGELLRSTTRSDTGDEPVDLITLLGEVHHRASWMRTTPLSTLPDNQHVGRPGRGRWELDLDGLDLDGLGSAGRTRSPCQRHLDEDAERTVFRLVILDEREDLCALDAEQDGHYHRGIINLATLHSRRLGQHASTGWQKLQAPSDPMSPFTCRIEVERGIF